MSTSERAVLFPCGADELVGVLALPDGETQRLGVLVVVGGPQYRVGSHRQFVLLSRDLALAGFACMRFDCRGMGDSDGTARSFEEIGVDIGAAVDEFMRQAPGVEGVVLWGLCDGASAACLYAPTDPRIAGLVLLNPWVRTDISEAKTVLKHYYLQRLIDPKFWKKLLGGGVAVGGSLGGLFQAASRARSRTGADGGASGGASLPRRMGEALKRAERPFLLLLSGRDYVAREFEQVMKADPLWTTICNDVSVERLEAADHTFSSAEWRAAVARRTADWVTKLRGKDQEE